MGAGVLAICTARGHGEKFRNRAALLLLPPRACLATGRAGGMKGSAAMSKPSSMFYVHEADVAQVHHFLDDCSLCAKSLSGDIFMYRGDTPFCSEECRQQQIEVDRAKHRRKKRAAAHALAARKEHQHRQQQGQQAGMGKPWVDAGLARAPALRV